MARIYFYIIIGALLIVDVVLVANNRKVNQNYQQLITKVSQPEKTLNQCWDLECFNKEFLSQQVDEIELIVFIPSITCLSSSEYALKFLEYQDSLDQFVKVVFVGKYFDPNYQEKLGIIYKKFNKMDDVFNKSFHLTRPAFVVMDKHNAHLLYEVIPEDGFKGEKIQAFWAGAEKFFAKVYSEDRVVD